jgi:cobalt transporter subunit CbtA
MLFRRLVWCALLTALLVGSVQLAVGRWQAVPIILAAEAFESRKAQSADPLPHAHASTAGHAHAAAHEHGDAHPADAGERTAWTWVAHVLHGFSMALLMFAVMGWWIWTRGAAPGTARLGLAVAAAGMLSLDLWPALGLPAEIPGLDAGSLGSRQVWWVLAATCAALACALAAGVATKTVASHWRWLAAAALLALPFVVGAPQPLGDPLAGFDAQARAQLQELQREFIWATRWTSLSFWVLLGLMGGWVFARWLKPAIPPRSQVRIRQST